MLFFHLYGGSKLLVLDESTYRVTTRSVHDTTKIAVTKITTLLDYPTNPGGASKPFFYILETLYLFGITVVASKYFSLLL